MHGIHSRPLSFAQNVKQNIQIDILFNGQVNFIIKFQYKIHSILEIHHFSLTNSPFARFECV